MKASGLILWAFGIFFPKCPNTTTLISRSWASLCWKTREYSEDVGVYSTVHWPSYSHRPSHVHGMLGLLNVLLDLRCDVEVKFLGHGQRRRGRRGHIWLPPVITNKKVTTRETGGKASGTYNWSIRLIAELSKTLWQEPNKYIMDTVLELLTCILQHGQSRPQLGGPQLGRARS